MEALPTYFTGLLAVLLLSAFVKILTTLSILRFGIGLYGAGFGLVIIGAALGLSLMVMNPQLEAAGGIDTVIQSERPAQLQLESRFRPFLEKHSHADVVERFTGLAEQLQTEEGGAAAAPEAEPAQDAPFAVLIAAFLVSELKEAFQLGFLILIPFLVIDLLVANVLLVLGVTQMSQQVVALPCKILLFFAVDGWTLLTEKLVSSYV